MNKIQIKISTTSPGVKEDQVPWPTLNGRLKNALKTKKEAVNQLKLFGFKIKN
jgi:hypothetical protein